jgi:hypothetical protein
MPICPGCGKSVAYNQLSLHERYCPELTDTLDARSEIESLDRRLLAIETQLNRRLLRIEAEMQASGSDNEQRNRFTGPRYRR